MGLLDLVKKLKNGLGAAADAVLPGDQSSWHQPAPAAQPTTQQRQTAAGVGQALGYGPRPSPLQPTQVSVPQTPMFKIAPPPIEAKKLNMPLETVKQAALGIGKSAGEMAQGVARIAPTVAVQVAQPGADAINNVLGNQKSPITIDPAKIPGGTVLFGKDPIKSYQAMAEDMATRLKAMGVNPTAASASTIAVAPILATLDLANPGRKQMVKQLAESTTEQAVKSILTKEFGQSVDNIPAKVITKIAKEKDAAKITTLLKGGDVEPQKVVKELLSSTPATGAKERGFIETVKESTKAAPEIKFNVSGSYDTLTNEQTFKLADAKINKMGYEQAIEHAKTNDTGDALNQAMSLRLADNLQQEGRFNDAIEVIQKIADRATKNGQDVQILAAYNRLTPEGIVRYAVKGIEDAKKEFPKRYGNLALAPEQAGALRQRATEIQAMPEGIDKMIATNDMLKDIAKLVPSTNTQKALTLWKAGLLTGIKGQFGNQIGNSSHLLLRKLADVPAASLDAAIGAFTGQRGKTFTLKGLLPGLSEGITAAKLQLKHGFDPGRIVNNKYDVKQTFFSDSPLGKAAQKYTDFVFRMTGATDRPYYYAALKNSLYDQAKAAAITQKVPLRQRRGWIEKFVNAPTEDALVRATSDAQESVFANDNVIGEFLKKGKGALNKGGALPGAIGELSIPFTGVPSAIATAVVNYSPIGGARAIYDAIKGAKAGTAFTVEAQRELSTALGRSVTGVGAMWLGYKLFLDGRLTLGYPTDPQERTLWAQEGKQPYSVMIGGKWRSINYTGPIMSLIGIGGQVAQNKDSGASTTAAPAAIAGAAGTAGQAIIASSPLKGIQSGLDFVSDPQRNAKSYLNAQAGSVVPTLVKDVSNATDNTKREVNTPADAIKARIPGVRTNLMPAIDDFGNQVAQEPTGIAAILDPFRSTDASTTPLVDELRRLKAADQGIVPTHQDANVTLGGVKVTLTPEQLNDYKQQVGGALTSAWNELISSSAYDQLDDAGKNNALKKVKDAVTKVVNAEYAKTNHLGNQAQARADLSGAAASVAAGHFVPEMFTVDSKNWTQAMKVQQLTDAYLADKKAGSLSPIDDYKRRKEIETAKKSVGRQTTAQIAANYSQDAVDLASLSKADVSALLASGQVSQSTYNEMTAYKKAVAANKVKTTSSKAKSTKVKIAKAKVIKSPKIKLAKAPSSKKIKSPKIKLAKITKPKFKVAKPVQVA